MSPKTRQNHVKIIPKTNIVKKTRISGKLHLAYTKRSFLRAQGPNPKVNQKRPEKYQTSNQQLVEF